MNKIILVTGGARSGKSRFAEDYVQKSGSTLAYIATAQIFDTEMARRVALHKKRRESHSWYTIEAPFAAEKAFLKLKTYDAVLFDCLTIYMSNIICLPEMADMTEQDRQAKIVEAIHKLMAAARKHDGLVVFVTNEVGAGIVPENQLARQYRDIAGICNQYMAQNANEVYLVVSGIPIQLK